MPRMLRMSPECRRAASHANKLQGAPWGPSAYRQLGEQAAALAKGRKAKSVATMLLSRADTSVPEAVTRRHEHVHDLEHRVRSVAPLLTVVHMPTVVSSCHDRCCSSGWCPHHM